MCVRYRVFGTVSPYVVCENGWGMCYRSWRADFRQRNTGVLRLIYMTMTTSVMLRFLDIR